MAKKVLRKLLNELISENEQGNRLPDLKHIVAFDIPVTQTDATNFKVNLNDVIDFQGIDPLLSNLLDQLRESCFFGQSDISVTLNIEKESCPQLYNFGVHKLFFYAAFENFEQLPLLYNHIALHLKYIFNALQSPAIYKGFLKIDEAIKTPALLFPFNRAVKDDVTGFHYLVEKVEGAHFLRITAEELAHSRLNFRRIDHRVISNIDLRHGLETLRIDASAIFSSIVTLCRNNRLSFKDSGLQLPTLINHLNNNGYHQVKELALNWNRHVAADVLLNGGFDWQGIVLRILMILTDSTTISLLANGKTLEVQYQQANAYISVTQRGRNVQIGLGEKVLVSPLDDYLVKMEELDRLTKNRLKPLTNTHIIFIHHFTNETLAVLGSFDYLGVHKTDTLWVKYSGGIPSRFMDTIMDLPLSTYRFYSLQAMGNNQFQGGFCLSDAYSPIDSYSDLNQFMKKQNTEFYPAMRLAAMHIFLNAIASPDNNNVLVAEDGGYLAPFINSLALEQKTVKEVFTSYNYNNESIAGETLNMLFSDWISEKYAGSVEHTRNGYDALLEVEKKFGQLAFPACSFAISNFKVNNESIEVAYSCVNAIENIMNGQGYVLNNRKCLVLGSLGAIGIQTMKILSARVGMQNISGIDIATKPSEQYDWQQLEKPEQIDAETRYSIDFIFGVIGKSILNAAFFDDLVINTNCRNIFMASGSTKQFEFSHFMQWAAMLQTSKEPSIGGFRVKTHSQSIEDPQTSATQGTILSVSIEKPDGEKQVNFYLLSSLMPVNFQYYGVPRETMDRVMTEFVSLINIVSRSDELSLPPKLLALDHAIKLNGELI
jgi:hypothetical protein